MTPALHNSRFMKACRGEAADCTPVWLMRQAGRYMEEYRRVRAKVSLLELCHSAELACEVTVTAQRRIGVDAAILFADLLPVLEPMGMSLEYREGDGPVLSPPVRDARAVDALREHDPVATMPFVYDAVARIRRELPPDIPLIGFTGMPFTLAAYLVEGRSSRNFEQVKRFMYTDGGAWRALMEKLSRLVVGYARAQVQAGAQVIQCFDSWVGCLSPADYREYVQPHSKAVLDALKGSAPVIHFGVGTATFLDDMARAGGDVIGLDWRTPIAPAWRKLGVKSVQGNLDPVVLLADRETVLRKAREVLEDAASYASPGTAQTNITSAPGHIFNLGHGILPPTPVGNVIALVDYVHEATAVRRL